MTADAAEIVRLAERAEQATGPDRELDADIFLEIRPAARGRIFNAPAYTASLDAAMTLIDGVGVLLGLSDIGADGLPLARVGVPDLPDAPVFTGIASCIMTKTAPVAGLALAVTAAALKARARAAQHDHEVG